MRLWMTMFLTLGLVLAAVPALPYGGGGGGAEENDLFPLPMTRSDPPAKVSRGSKYTRFTSGVHDKASAEKALQEYTSWADSIKPTPNDTGDSYLNSMSWDDWEKRTEEQLVMVLIATIAWSENPKFPPAVQHLAMIMEAHVEDGDLRPTQALEVMMVVLGTYYEGSEL